MNAQQRLSHKPSGSRLAFFCLALCGVMLCSCQSLPNSSRPSPGAAQPPASPTRLAATPQTRSALVPSMVTDRDAGTVRLLGPTVAEPGGSKGGLVASNAPDELGSSSEIVNEIVTEGGLHCQPEAVAAPHAVHPKLPSSLPSSAYGPEWVPLNSSSYISAEEYVCNGGDRDTAVMVKRDWTVHGLHPGDTIVHFDTIDGQTRVQPSNEVCLYAPRFAAVRKVYGVVISEQHDRPAGVEAPLTAVQSNEVNEATTVVQPLQPGRQHAVKTAQLFHERALGEGIENVQRPATAQERFLPFEDLLIIRRGSFDNNEKARLATRLEAAVVWTNNQAPQVIIDNKTAVQVIGTTAAQSIYTYELPPGKSRVRIVKIASHQNVRSGETVDFTIRFDNVGDRTIGNVTIIDRLHDRLELVPNTHSCTLDHEFFTEDEEGSPRVLRWEIQEPMKVGEGGIIRFQCRVR